MTVDLIEYLLAHDPATYDSNDDDDHDCHWLLGYLTTLFQVV
jgi:hypothetical protein